MATIPAQTFSNINGMISFLKGMVCTADKKLRVVGKYAHIHLFVFLCKKMNWPKEQQYQTKKLFL